MREAGNIYAKEKKVEKKHPVIDLNGVKNGRKGN